MDRAQNFAKYLVADSTGIKKAPCHGLGAFDMEWWLHKERNPPYACSIGSLSKRPNNEPRPKISRAKILIAEPVTK